MGFSLGVSDSRISIMQTQLTASAQLYFVGLNPQAVAVAGNTSLGIGGAALVNNCRKILLLKLAHYTNNDY